MRRLVPILLLILALGSSPALAETRVALVIGNFGYASAGELKNPKNDAEAIAAALTKLGFKEAVDAGSWAPDRPPSGRG